MAKKPCSVRVSDLVTLKRGDWAKPYVEATYRTEPFTAEERERIALAARRLYAAASLDEPVNVVFADGPVTGFLAAGVAAGVWFLREHPEMHRALFECERLSEVRLRGAIPDACAVAVDSAITALRLDGSQREKALASTIRVALAASAPKAPDIVLREAVRRAIADAAANAVADAGAVVSMIVEGAAAEVVSRIASDAILERAARACAAVSDDAARAVLLSAITVSVEGTIRKEILQAVQNTDMLPVRVDSTLQRSVDASFAGREATEQLEQPDVVPEVSDLPGENGNIAELLRPLIPQIVRDLDAKIDRNTLRSTVRDVHMDRTSGLIYDRVVSVVERAIAELVSEAVLDNEESTEPYADADVWVMDGRIVDLVQTIRDLADRRVGLHAFDALRDILGAIACRSACGDPLVRFLALCCRGSFLTNRRSRPAHDARMLVEYAAYRDVLRLPIDFEAWNFFEVLAVAGPYYARERFCIVSERPETIFRPTAVEGMDGTNGAVHSTTSPTLCWRDGLALYHFRGTPVPQAWIERPESIDPTTVLSISNAEERRAALEIVGWARVLDSMSAEVVDADADPQIGTLLRAQIPRAQWGGVTFGTEKISALFLKVRCATGRDFAIPVPTDMRTAAQANAWSYNITEEQLRELEVRT